MRTKKLNDTLSKDWFYFLPIIFFSAVIPLVVHLKIINLDVKTKELFIVKLGYNFFSYYKMLSIITSGIVGMIFLIIWLSKHKVKTSTIYIPMFSYIIFIILSIIFSENKKISLIGFYNLYEGGLVLISYILIMFITINFVNKKQHIQLVLYAIIISSVIISVIGIFQYFGYDFFKSYFGIKLILPFKYNELSKNLNFSFGKYMVYSTFSNPNYVGSYMSMLFPLSIGLFLIEDRIKHKIILGIATCLVFSNWIGSRSFGGLIGGVIGLVILFILLRKIIKKKILLISVLIFMFTIIFLFMFLNPKGNINDKINILYKADIGNIEKEKIIKDIKLKNNVFMLKTKSEILYVTIEDNRIVFKDNEKELKIQKNAKENTYFIKDNRYRDYNIYYNNRNILVISKNNTNIKLKVDSNKKINFINYKGEVIDVSDIDIFGHNIIENFASKRGYIWSRSIPMLKETLFKGYGPDNFVLYFPQNDILGKYKAYGSDSVIVNKPHNMYLQIGINTGVISLISVIAMFLIYIISSIKLFYKNNNGDFYSYLSITIFSSICGYLVTGLANDSTNSVAPVFWTLFGLGISINLTLKKKQIF